MSFLSPKNFASPLVPRALPWILGVGVSGLGVLLALARAEVHGASKLSTLAAVSTMLALALGARFLARQSRVSDRWPTVLGLWGGLLAAAVYLCEISAEYLWMPSNNVHWGWIEFTVVLALIVATAWQSGRISRSVRAATLASVQAAFVSYLYWGWGLVGTRLLYAGTERQMRVLVAEGDLEDFTRSGMESLETFLFEDLVGALFFHALLSVVVGGLLGMLCGWLAVLADGKRGNKPVSP